MDTANGTLDRPQASTRIPQAAEALRTTRKIGDDQSWKTGLRCQPANRSEEEERAYHALTTRKIVTALKAMHQK